MSGLRDVVCRSDGMDVKWAGEPTGTCVDSRD